jgi:hypothetical protein
MLPWKLCSMYSFLLIIIYNHFIEIFYVALNASVIGNYKYLIIHSWKLFLIIRIIIKITHMCEAQCCYVSEPGKVFLCGKEALYVCKFCHKHFCIDCMYLLCDQCYREISCFWCGFSLKHQKHYCSNCQLKKEKLS